MKRLFLIAVVIVLVFVLSVPLLFISYMGSETNSESTEVFQEEKQHTDESEATVISDLVKGFGGKLQFVSLLAPNEILEKNMREYYGDYVSPELIEKWINDPLNAPGRLTSSPWPDRIEILSIVKLSESEYEVRGEIIEITSTEKESGEFANKRPITLIVKKLNNRWLIDEVNLGEYEKTNFTIYKNMEYGFEFSLPKSWENYQIINGEWEGLAIGSDGNEKVVQSGPIISLRHPEWASDSPRQDIPIMIFTLSQWTALQQQEFHIGAAPIGPKELGRNSKYVFALPARYNFAFPKGYEEVEDILEGNPLVPIEGYCNRSRRFDGDE